jgi:hypothetical protein
MGQPDPGNHSMRAGLRDFRFDVHFKSIGIAGDLHAFAMTSFLLPAPLGPPAGEPSRIQDFERQAACPGFQLVTGT